MTDSPLPRAAQVAGIVFAALLGLLVIVTMAAGAWVGVRGVLAYGHLTAAEQAARTAAADLSDPVQASRRIDAISAETSAARALTSDPVWKLAEGLPWIGPQLSAVSTVAAATDDVAGTALEPLVSAASTFSIDDLRPVDGQIDVSTFTEIQDAALAGATGIAGASASVDAIDRAPLLTPLRKAVDQVADLLDSTRASTDALARATVLIPAMLGADGPRDYLVLFQNNAEWRSLGGIPGAMALIHTDGGRIQLAGQASTADFPKYADPVLGLGDEITAIYGDRPALWIQNVTQVPDFTVSGPLAREMWAREHGGQQVDGVIALDPVTLSYLLEATGPVALPTGDVLTSENAISLLLNEVYFRYEKPADQDVFFATAAASVFQALSSGSADPAKLVAALGRAGDERRLLLWSAHPEDQKVLDDTTLAGHLPPADAEVARFGVYVNDGTGSKMSYYTTADTTIEWDECTVDAGGAVTGTATVTLTVTSNAPADTASLPDYITGGGGFGVPAGTARVVGYVYLPPGFELVAANLSTGDGFGGGNHDGRRVLSFSVDLTSGMQATATISGRTTVPGSATVAAERTPTIESSGPVAATCGGS